MRLININCNDKQSFKYFILLYIYYYNIQNNHGRVAQLNNNLNPYIHIKFNENSDILQFEKDNRLIDLFIIDVNADPIFLTRNNADIKITIVKLNGNSYSLHKPSIECFNSNVSEINRLNRSTREKYILTDEIKKELSLDPDAYQKCA